MEDFTDLLMAFREAWDDMELRKDAVKLEAARKVEEEKTGERLVSAVTNRRRPANNGISTAFDEVEGTLQRSVRKKRRIQEVDVEMDAFGTHMKEAEFARVNLEQSCLSFDREIFIAECEEREKDHAKRRAE